MIQPVTPHLHPDRLALTTITRSGDRFVDFSPYVASVDDRGVVAFQAELAGGGSGVFAGSGGEVAELARGDVVSHPDAGHGGEVCFYVRRAGGREALVIAGGGATRTLADTGEQFTAIGPLGPSMNAGGAVAFRATGTDGGDGLFVAAAGGITTVADSGDELAGFEGIPVITGDGAVLFRARRAGGGDGIYRWRDGQLETIAETGERFAELGRFPAANDRGTVVFAAVLAGGGSGIFAAGGDPLVDTGAGFSSFRGALVDDAGRVIFYATPAGGALGIYSGPDPIADRIVGLGDDGVVDLALNPVSINGAGQLAIRVALAGGEQRIIRADRAA